MNKQPLAKIIILAVFLLSLMCVHVALFVPPIWTIPASIFVGMSYYFLRLSIVLIRRESNLEQTIFIYGFESIIATATAYGLFVGLYVLWR